MLQLVELDAKRVELLERQVTLQASIHKSRKVVAELQAQADAGDLTDDECESDDVSSARSFRSELTSAAVHRSIKTEAKLLAPKAKPSDVVSVAMNLLTSLQAKLLSAKGPGMCMDKDRRGHIAKGSEHCLAAGHCASRVLMVA